MRILVAEDERDLNRVIVKKMQSEGYVVDSCFDGEEALDYLKYEEYDVALVDIMMPKMDGFQTLQEARKQGIKTPVIFLTAKDTIDDKVKGLDLGANDYIVKPFSFKELLARIRVVTRVADSRINLNKDNIYQVSDLTLDISSHQVKRGDQEVHLTQKEYALLEVLVRNKGHVLSREQIEDNLWDFDSRGGTNAVDVYIRYLRKKIDEPFEKKLIQTIRGVGYVIKE